MTMMRMLKVEGGETGLKKIVLLAVTLLLLLLLWSKL